MLPGGLAAVPDLVVQRAGARPSPTAGAAAHRGVGTASPEPDRASWLWAAAR